MGSWGPGLYEDDVAADLKKTIGLLVKVPAGGDRLLELLRQTTPPDEEDTSYWLVVADQFERRGIDSPEATERALAAIDSGADLIRLRELGLDAKGVAKREKVLTELAGRLRAPRPLRGCVSPARPPAMVVAAGEVYAFPAMRGRAARATSDWERQRFEPDGWGALIVLETGRAFDWLPWCAVASVSVDRTRRPDLEAVLGGRLIFNPETFGAARCVPNASHLRRMKAGALGRLALAPGRAARLVSPWPMARVLECGWPISNAAFSDVGSIPLGDPVTTLLTD